MLAKGDSWFFSISPGVTAGRAARSITTGEGGSWHRDRKGEKEEAVRSQEKPPAAVHPAWRTKRATSWLPREIKDNDSIRDRKGVSHLVMPNSLRYSHGPCQAPCPWDSPSNRLQRAASFSRGSS